MPQKRTIRCAIYTRKSSDEGLDQEFNSLDAQREACEAYIASQKHEGWKLLPQHYDDGGVSGATMERKGLRRLLDDIDAGIVDLVVVYKVDRLTRSLADFAKLIERLDASGSSFVSVTQAFNTSTSMGRLTLNVLLSFAQFEREVTAERIRDKIAQSKAKGMWMGGNVPLGYDVDGRSLKPHTEEAKIVVRLFELYDELDCLRQVEQRANKAGYRTKVRQMKNGRTTGGGPFSRGRIQHILRNPLYVGKVRHKNVVYDGLHDPVIDQDLFERVQAKLDAASKRIGKVRKARVPSPLAGRIFDEHGHRLTPSHTTRGPKRFRYYVSQSLVKKSGGVRNGVRLPAQTVEGAVASAIKTKITQNRAMLLSSADQTLEGVEKREQTLDLLANAEPERLLELATRVVVGPTHLGIKLRLPTDAWAGCDPVEILEPFTVRRRGVERKIILGDARPTPDETLQRTLGRALNWRDRILAGERMEALAEDAGVSSRFLRDRLQLAFLSPVIMTAILNGTQPVDLSTNTFVRSDIPLDWSEQEKMFGFNRPSLVR